MNTSPLKAMFWKECRENARWAALALLALSLGLIYAWYHLFQQPYWPSFSNVWSTENLVLTITTPLIGLTLGLLQVLPELRRDQWAFLVHRPASRTTLFFGKALAGVCLYLLATTLPLLVLSAWASSPSHVPAPFDFRFTLAGWASVLAGLPLYFAGLLIALRPARWYGSRVLPLLTALLAPFAAATFYQFWQVCLACLCLSAVLLAAAWGSFLTGGEYKEQTKPARFALGLILYPAVIATAVGVLLLLAGAYNLLSGAPRGAETWRNDYKIDTQGRIFYTSEHDDGKGHTSQTVTDAAGRPVDPRLWQNLTQQHKLLDFAYLPVGELNQEGYYRYSDSSRYVISLTSSISDAHQTYWYYETGAHQIVGYSVTAQVPSVIGYLGPNGFGKDAEQAGRFTGPRPEPTELLGLHLLRFSQAIYWYDTSVPTAGVLQATPGGISGAALLGVTDSGRSDEAQALIVAAGSRLTAYTRGAPGTTQTPAFRRLFTTPLVTATDPKTFSNIEAAIAPDRSRFFFWYGALGGSVTGSLITVASDGRVLRTEAVPPAKQAGAPSMPHFIQAAPALVIPPAILTAISLCAFVGHVLGWSSVAGFWNTLEGIGPISFFSALSGLLAALPAWLISRRLGDGRRGQFAWALGSFLLGGYGVLLLLALRPWPARQPCPDCRKQRVVDNQECEHCGAVWARPKRDGTEVFDAAGREAAAR